MISRLVLAIVVFLVVGLGLTYLLGPFLLALAVTFFAVPFLAIFGEFFEKWGWVLGAAAGLWHFFSGWRPW